MAPRYQKTFVELPDGRVPVYASPKVKAALDEVMEELTLYHGVRLAEVLAAVYRQGRKDGARAVFEGLQKSITNLEVQTNPYNPGQKKPRKRVKK